MYKVIIDGVTVHNPELDDQDALLLGGVVAKQANKADAFEFTIYPNNKGYGHIRKLTSVVEVFLNNERIFRGRPINVSEGWENQQKVTCEGGFAFFNDTILRPYEYQGTVRDYLQMLVNQHNSQVSQDKRFIVRNVTITDSNDNIVRSNSDYVSTISEMQEKLINNLGGYFMVEYDAGNWYLDYLADSTYVSTQKITLSKNLIDFAREQKAGDIATAMIPLGAKDESTGERLTIKSVNGGVDYIEDAAAVAQYGRIFTTKIWDDVTVAANLLAKAQQSMSDLTTIIPEIKLTAVDLSVVDQTIDVIRLLDYVTVEDSQHSVSGQYLVMERTYNLSAPERDQVTFGGSEQSISSSAAGSAAVSKNLPARLDDALAEARRNSRQIIEDATSGNIYFRYDENGKVYEVDIMDTDDPSTAQKIWRWNINGWGYSRDGGQTYTLAATMDGSIVADFITTGVLTAIEINNGNGTFRVTPSGALTASSATISGRVTATDGAIGGFAIDSTSIHTSGVPVTSNADNSVGLSSSVFTRTIGGESRANLKFAIGSNFGVTKDGTIYTKDAYITGEHLKITSEYSGDSSNESLIFRWKVPSTGSVHESAVIAGNLITQRKASSQMGGNALTNIMEGIIGVSSDDMGTCVLFPNALMFSDGNTQKAYFYANQESNCPLLGSFTTNSYASVSVANMGTLYRAFLLTATRGQGRGAMDTTVIPLALAKKCTSDSVCSWVYSAQNSAYSGRCYFDFTNNLIYGRRESTNTDCYIQVYGLR